MVSRLLGQDNNEIGGYVLIWSGQNEKHQHDVAILITRKWLKRIHLQHDIKFIINRIMQINVVINNRKISITSVYAPTNCYKLDKKMPSMTSYKISHRRFQQTFAFLFAEISTLELVAQVKQKNSNTGKLWLWDTE